MVADFKAGEKQREKEATSSRFQIYMSAMSFRDYMFDGGYHNDCAMIP